MPFPELENYKIEKKLGQKLCYFRYKAIDQRNGNTVCLKVLKKEQASDPDVSANFINGARIARMVNHPSIAKIYDYGAASGHHYISSEVIEFEPIKTLILDTFSLSVEDLAKIFTNIARTLSFSHLHGVVHGFLNPNNVFVNTNGEIKIDDLGFNWYTQKLFEKNTKEAHYYAQYVAPELYSHSVTADGRVDIYSLGVILYEFLTGKNPFSGNNIRSIQKLHLAGKVPHIDFDRLELPLEFRQVVNRALNKIPEKRYQNLNEFAQSFEIIQTHSPTAEEVADEKFSAVFDPHKAQERPPETPADSVVRVNLWRSGIGKFAFPGLGGLAILIVIVFMATNFFSTSAENGLSDSPAVTGKPPQTSSLNPNDNLGTETNRTDNPDSPGSQSSNNGGNHQGEAVEPSLKVDLSEDQSQRPTTLQSINPMATTVDFVVRANDSPVVASIYLDDQFMGTTDENGQLRVAQLVKDKAYAARVTKDGYLPVTKTLTPSSDSMKVLFDIETESQPSGTLLVNAIPAVDSIFVNGAFHTGNKSQIKLSPGQYRVRLVNSNLNKSWQETVSIRDSQTARLNHDFTIVELGTVAVSIENAFEVGFGYVYVDGKIWPETNNTTPLEISLPVGMHTISVKREGFISSPPDTAVTIFKDTPLYLSFHLTKQ